MKMKAFDLIDRTPLGRVDWRLIAVAAAVWLAMCPAAVAADFMFRARVDGQMREGKPLAWSASQMLLLGRDGQLYDFNPRKAQHAEKTSPRFFGLTSLEMKQQLQREFGKDFDVTTTRHYVVVHPRGERDQWANRFEELYRSFEHYFRVRGFTQREPQFPLVAVVYRDEAEYFRAAAAGGTPMRQGTLGHYDPRSNRVLLFDVTSAGNGVDWSRNAETIIHEATHQTAFNVGIHTRFAEMPKWVVEGLATMFEPRGVWDSRSYPDRQDRINRERLDDFHEYAAPRHKPGDMVELVTSDELFRSDPRAAYAEAWALSFYLCETRPRLYAEYLAKTADRAMFTPYPADERLADFEDIFGSDLRMLEVKFLRYMEELK
jgi:hypothetical protein